LEQKTENLRTPEEAPYRCPKCGVGSDNPITVCDGHDDEGCNIQTAPSRAFRKIAKLDERLINAWKTADALNLEDPRGAGAYWPEFEEALRDIVGDDANAFELASRELKKILNRSAWKTAVLTMIW